MKLKLMMMVIAMAAFSAITVKAQADESRVKVLSTEKPGILKLVSAIEIENGATVNFITDEGIVLTDQIKGSFPKGFAKKYDIRHVDKEFWIEVDTQNLTVTYHIVPSKDRKSFESTMETAVHKYDVVVASRD